MSRSVTPYAETEALLAQMDGDYERRDQILTDMYPTELKTFGDQLMDLAYLVRAEHKNKHEKVVKDLKDLGYIGDKDAQV